MIRCERSFAPAAHPILDEHQAKLSRSQADVLLLRRHNIEAIHAAHAGSHHMYRHMAVIVPGTRSVFGKVEGVRSAGANHDGIDELSGIIPGMGVYVKCMEIVAQRDDSPANALSHFGALGRGIAQISEAIEAVEILAQTRNIG